MSEPKAPTGSHQIRVERFDTFEAARQIWLDLEARTRHYAVQGYHWLAHWQHKVGDAIGVEPRIVAVFLGKQLLMLLPLGTTRKAGATCVVWLGGEITDYHAPLLHEDYSSLTRPEDFPAIWDRVVEALPPHDAIHLEKMPESIVDRPNPFMALAGSWVQDVNLYCALDSAADWPSFAKQQTRASFEADSRRKRRRLSEIGAVKFRVASTPEEAIRFTECMIAQKTARYLDTDTFNLFQTPEYANFLNDPSPELIAEGHLHVSALEVNGVIIATHWGLVADGRFYYLMASFATGRWSRYSPGRLMLESLLQWCFEHDVKIFDFTIGGEQFKRGWANREQLLRERLEPRSARGRILALTESIKRMIRRSPGLHGKINHWRNRRGETTGQSGDGP